MTTETQLMTGEDFYRRANEFGRSELLDGRVVKLMPASRPHNRTIAKLAQRLGNFLDEHPLGELMAGDTGIYLRRNPDRVRAPDVCFFAAGRLAPDEGATGWLEQIPDLAVEVISPGDTLTEVQEKVEEWLQAGARLLWAPNPRTRTVLVWTGLDGARILREGDTLTGEPVLPGFAVAVADLFA